MEQENVEMNFGRIENFVFRKNESACFDIKNPLYTASFELCLFGLFSGQNITSVVIGVSSGHFNLVFYY